MNSITHLRWLPCAKNDTKKNDEPKKISTYCRMVPGLLALAANIVAVVCALIFKSPYICLVPGVLSSIYLLYQGGKARRLKTFSENNNQLEHSIQTFQIENKTLETRIKEFGDENQNLQQSTIEMNHIVENLQEENSNLNVTNKSLRESVEELQKIKESLEVQAGTHIKQLCQLEKSLSVLEASTRGDYTTFSQNLEAFKYQVHALQSLHVAAEKNGFSFESKLAQQLELLFKTATMMQSIFTTISEWNSGTFVERSMHEQEILTQNLITIERQISNAEGRVEEQKLQLEKLAEIKKGFEKALIELLEEIAVLKDLKSEFSEGVEKVTKAAYVFQRYELSRLN